MSAQQRPQVTFPLPGTWATFPLDGTQAVTDALRAVEEGGEGSSSIVDAVTPWLRALADVGGVELMIRTGTDIPTSVVTAWPALDPAEASAAGLRTALGDAGEEAVDLDREDGFATFRLRRRTGDVVISSYWTAPLLVAGAVFMLEVCVAAPDDEMSAQLAMYDAIARSLAWPV